MRPRGGRHFGLGGRRWLGLDLLPLPLLLEWFLFGRALVWRLPLRRVGWRLFLGGRGLDRLGLAATEQTLEQAGLLALVHNALTASNAAPSSPETTASTS